MNVIHVLLIVLATAGMLGCYEIADRMRVATRHSMRAAVLVIGAGCIVTIGAAFFPWLGEPAIILLLTGCGLYRFFDERVEGWRHVRDRADAAGAVATVPDQRAVRPNVAPHSGNSGVAGNLHLQVIRARAVRRA